MCSKVLKCSTGANLRSCLLLTRSLNTRRTAQQPLPTIAARQPVRLWLRYSQAITSIRWFCEVASLRAATIKARGEEVSRCRGRLWHARQPKSILAASLQNSCFGPSKARRPRVRGRHFAKPVGTSRRLQLLLLCSSTAFDAMATQMRVAALAQRSEPPV